MSHEYGYCRTAALDPRTIPYCAECWSATYLLMVTAGRDWTDREAIEGDLLKIEVEAKERNEHVMLIHGDCDTGGDQIADRFARCVLDWEVRPIPADWQKHGKAAGPIRNAAMVKMRPRKVLAYPMPRSKGTWDAVRKAQAAGLNVVVREARTNATAPKQEGEA